MKILYLSSVRIPSEKASGLAIVRQCEAFVKNGHELELLIPVRDRSTATIASVYNIEPNFFITKFPSRPVYNLGRIGFFYMTIRDSLRLYIHFKKNDNKTDVIYARDMRLLFFFVVFGLGQKCYLEIHTKYSDSLAKYLIRRVKKVVVISSGLKDYYQRFANRIDIQIEPSGVNIDQFQHLPSKDALRKKLQLPTDKLILSYIGKYMTMGESKGVEEIIKAFSAIVKVRKDVFLYLVGMDENEKLDLEKIFNDQGVLPENYKIIDLQQDIFAEYLIASDVLLMNYPDTPHYANYMSPTKLFAYLAAGKPIVSSDLPSVREIQGIKGILFAEPDSIESYTNQLITVIDDYNHFLGESTNNVILVKQFSWPERAKRILVDLNPVY